MLLPLSILTVEAVLLVLFVACGEGWASRVLAVVLFAVVLTGTTPRYLPLVLVPGVVLLVRILHSHRSSQPSPLEPPSRLDQAKADQQTAREARQEALVAAHDELERHHACVVRLESLR